MKAIPPHPDLPRARLGDVVVVEFFDHALVKLSAGETFGPVQCRVYGRLIAREKGQIIVRHWETTEEGRPMAGQHEESHIRTADIIRMGRIHRPH